MPTITTHKLGTCTGSSSNEATFLPATQKVVNVPGHGIFIVWPYTMIGPDPRKGSWRVQRSTDGGATWSTIYDSVNDNFQHQTFAIETDKNGNVYVFAETSSGSIMDFFKFTPPNYTSHTHVGCGASSQKFGCCYDPYRDKLVTAHWTNLSTAFRSYNLDGSVNFTVFLYHEVTSGNLFGVEYPMLAPGPNGLLVAAWTSVDKTKMGQSPLTNYYDVCMCTSTDGGHTWAGKNGNMSLPISPIGTTGPAWECVDTSDRAQFLPYSDGSYGDGNKNYITGSAWNNGMINVTYRGDRPQNHWGIYRHNVSTHAYAWQDNTWLAANTHNVDATFCQDATYGGTLYMAGHTSGGYLRVMSSDDGGVTWSTYATGSQYFNPSNLSYMNTARFIDDEHAKIHGIFTLVTVSGSSADVYYWSIDVPATGPSPTAPANTARPVISGTAQENQTLNASAGTWSGSTPMNFDYAWSDGATGSSNTLTAADVGNTLTVTVTASNSAGTGAPATSQPVGPVTAATGVVTETNVFPTTAQRDAFNYTANPLPAPWTTYGFSDASLQANGSVAFSAAADGVVAGGMYTDITVTSPPVEVYVDLAQIPADPTHRVNLLWGNTDATMSDTTFYGYRVGFWNANGGSVVFTNVEAGVVTNIGPTLTGVGLLAAGDSIGFSIDQSATLTAYRKHGGVWYDLGSVQDSSPVWSLMFTPPMQYIGVNTADASTQFGNFSGDSAAFPRKAQVSIVDRFDYTANPLGGQWMSGIKTMGAMQANGSVATMTTSPSATAWQGGSFTGVAQEAYVDITSVPASASNTVSLYWVNQQAATGLLLYALRYKNSNNGTVELWHEPDDVTGTVLLDSATGVGLLANGDGFGVRFTWPNIITAYHREGGVWSIAATFIVADPLWTPAGNPPLQYLGFGSNDAGAQFDNFGGGGFPLWPQLDGFNYTLNPIANNWTSGANGYGGMRANGTSAIATGAGGGAGLWTGNAWPYPPVEMWTTVATVPSAPLSTTNIALWYSSAATVDANHSGYRIDYLPYDPSIRIQGRLNNAAYTMLGSKMDCPPLANGDSFGVRIDEYGMFTILFNQGGTWSIVASYRDTNPLWKQSPNVPLRYIGFSANDSTVAFDNFGGGGARTLYVPSDATTIPVPSLVSA